MSVELPPPAHPDVYGRRHPALPPSPPLRIPMRLWLCPLCDDFELMATRPSPRAIDAAYDHLEARHAGWQPEDLLKHRIVGPLDGGH